MKKLQSYFRRYAALQGIFILLLGVASMQTAQAEPSYVGSESCLECHPAKYNDWKVSGHPYKLMKSEEARNRPIPLPHGYEWDDISYVIGGYKWKSRYMDKDGYIITSHLDENGDPIAGLTQYNNLTDEWVDYHAGEELLPYNCGSCHTTGWVENLDPGDVTGNQDGLPGIHGTFEFGGIHCEECHGPASGHVNSSGNAKLIVDKSSLSCGGCHIRGESDTIPASGGFIKHHEQFNELLASPHNDDNGAGCVDCHDSHKKSEFSVIQTCESCHEEEAASYAGTEKEILGVTCVDCHMSMASKSAAALGLFKGDVKTHLFRINTDPEARMFTEDGSFVLLDDEGEGSVTMDFACISCHQDQDLDWAAENAVDFHSNASEPGVDLDIKSFSVTKKIALSRVKPIVIKLTVNNGGLVEGSAPATVTGVQNGDIVHQQTLEVTDAVGNGSTRYTLDPYTPDAVGEILWTMVIADGDPDDDVAIATTTVNP